jgi:hypothetical protein
VESSFSGHLPDPSRDAAEEDAPYVTSVVLLAFCLLATAACGPSQLSRAKAEQLLQAAIKASPPTTGEIQIGQRYSIVRDSDEWAKALVNKGMITDADLGTRWVNPYQAIRGHFHDAELTDAGAKFKLSERPTRDDYAGTTFKLCNMRMADQEFVAITGIRQNSAGESAQVEFTWRYTNLTPFGEIAPLLGEFGAKLD